MRTFIDLSIFYLKYLLKKNSFVYIVLFLLFIGFYIIPSPNASYVTFYMKNTTPISNKYWIGNLAAVFSNLIISFFLIFIILGEKEKEINQKIFYLEDTSPLDKVIKYSYKILAIYSISCIFLIILNTTLSIVNFKVFGLSQFFIPILYFCLPYLLLWSVFCFFVEYFIPYKGLKYFFYYTTLIIIFSHDELFKLIGVSELGLYLGNYTHSSDYSVGLLRKSQDLKFIKINKTFHPIFYSYKILWIFFTCILIIIISKLNLQRKLEIIEQDKVKINDSLPNQSLNKTYHLNKVPLQVSSSFYKLLEKDFFLLSQTFSRMNIFFILLTWILILFLSNSSQKILLPIIFLLCLPLSSNFLCKLYFYDLSYLEKISIFGKIPIFISKMLMIIGVYTFLVSTYFLSIPLEKIILVITYLFGLAFLQLFLINYFKNSILVDILYIILFTSYFSGYPIINILQL